MVNAGRLSVSNVREENMKGKKADALKVGDEVMFSGLVTFPSTPGVIYNGWYRIEGFVPDAMGKKHVCLDGVPGCWPVSKLGFVRAGA